MAPDSARSASWGRGIAAPGDVAVELGEDEDGDAQLAGEGFEAAGDVGDFQAALFDADAGGDELEVVDDEEGEVGVLGFEPPGAGFEVAEDEAGGVVEVEVGGGELAGGGVEVAPLAAGEVGGRGGSGWRRWLRRSRASRPSSSVRISREKTPTGLLQVDGDVAGEVEGEGGLAHARAGRRGRRGRRAGSRGRGGPSPGSRR